MKRITLDVSEELHQQIKQQAATSGFTTMAQWLRWIATNAIQSPEQPATLPPARARDVKARSPSAPTDVKATVEALKMKHLENPYKD